MPLRSAQPQERTRKEARFRHLRTMTPIIADRESGKPLFCAVWMRLYEDEITSVEGRG